MLDRELAANRYQVLAHALSFLVVNDADQKSLALVMRLFGGLLDHLLDILQAEREPALLFERLDLFVRDLWLVSTRP